MTYLYHITHINNLDSILKSGFIYSKNNNPRPIVNIAYEGIQDRRARKQIAIKPFGCLHDYVPFYLCPRCPMLLAIHNNAVENYKDGQDKIIHLVTTTDLIINDKIQFVFSDGHAAMDISEFFNSITDIDKLDWETIKAEYWANTDDDPDKKRRKQAEFLVYEKFPVTGIIGIGVMNENIKQASEKILLQNNIKNDVKIIKKWYY